MGIEQLYNKYKEERNIYFTLFDFASMITMYPGFLVANADKVFSMKEKEVIVDTLKIVTNEDWLKTCEMFCELSYLMFQGKEKYEDELLTCLAELLAESHDDNINEKILLSMTSVAQSEDGISEAELQMINQIREKLKI